ncbi:hypothetical protein A9P82_13665 [Arachidicoccus ginsenosidimutans]|nr:hypothetical protein A9P82_13665 [Arachidicoccus sp. BS20]
MAYNRLQSKHGAEDVVQDVLSTLWTRREKLEIKSLNHYLSSAVRYSIFHAMRKQLKEDELTKALHINGNTFTTIDESLKYQLIEEAVRKEIDRLPDKCKLVFQYSRELGMSNREIAEELQLSSKTVEAHITRAIRQLRSALKSSLSSFFSLFF